MTMRKPFRFGVTGITAQTKKQWHRIAQKIESLGFDTLCVWDHFDQNLAPLLALVTAAHATTSLRMGTLVLANDFRHPAVLAKEAATLDVLSEGRLELGIGAGWNKAEYGQAGLSFDAAPERVQRLTESITILKQLFRPQYVTFTGNHYTIDRLQGAPLPIQQPHPPIMIGGARKQMLQLAAQEADIVALATKVYPDGRHDFLDSTGPYITQKMEIIRTYAQERFPSLEFQIHIGGVILANDRSVTAEQIGPTVGLTGAQLLDCYQALIGTEEQIIEDLQVRREKNGISYITIAAKDMDTFAPIAQQLRGK